MYYIIVYYKDSDFLNVWGWIMLQALLLQLCWPHCCIEKFFPIKISYIQANAVEMDSLQESSNIKEKQARQTRQDF